MSGKKPTWRQWVALLGSILLFIWCVCVALGMGLGYNNPIDSYLDSWAAVWQGVKGACLIAIAIATGTEICQGMSE